MLSTHLGPYSDLIEAAAQSKAAPPPENEIQRLLEFHPRSPIPLDPKIEKTWRIGDDLLAEEITWSCGYGPRTEAWLYHPADAPAKPRPGIVLLHDHGAFKYWGKEKVGDGPNGPEPGIPEMRHDCYGNRAVATILARAGYTVLVPDAFLWGSRKIPYATIPEGDRHLGNLLYEDQLKTGNSSDHALPEEVRRYNNAAQINEHTIAKYATLLGTSLAGIINFEDQVATNYLHSRTDICTDWIACAGLSGGGLRSALLRATSDKIKAAIIVGMMTAYAGLLDHHLILHTWMLYPPALARKHDWPHVVSHNPNIPTLIQYDRDDQLFSLEGMTTADTTLRAAFEKAGLPQNYTGQFHPGLHKWDAPMQDASLTWLQAQSTR